MGPSELGRQWPQAALQESLQPPTAKRLVHPGATALGVLREAKEANGEKRKGWRYGDSNRDFLLQSENKITGMHSVILKPCLTFSRQDNISKNYHSIRLKPDQFSTYLTTEVGFTSFEYLGAPKCSVRGNSLICHINF